MCSSVRFMLTHLNRLDEQKVITREKNKQETLSVCKVGGSSEKWDREDSLRKALIDSLISSPVYSSFIVVCMSV